MTDIHVAFDYARALGDPAFRRRLIQVGYISDMPVIVATSKADVDRQLPGLREDTGWDRALVATRTAEGWDLAVVDLPAAEVATKIAELGCES